MKVAINKKKLPTEGRSSLNKAVKNVKEILQTKSKHAKTAKNRPKKSTKILWKKRKNRDQNRLGRGIVYVGHIPHGFYEDQMKDYFEQFGHVSRVRLSRSKETGKSRGYGYIEFTEPSVAKIAAETMNNYLMCGRLVKTTYIPPEQQHNGFFSKNRWTKEHYPRKMQRIKEVKKLNAPETEEKHKSLIKKSVKRLGKLSDKLKKQGLDVTFKISTKNL